MVVARTCGSQVNGRAGLRIACAGGKLHLCRRSIDGNDVISRPVFQPADGSIAVAALAIDHPVSGLQAVIRAQIDGFISVGVDYICS